MIKQFKKKYLTIILIFLFLYFIVNLFGGQRGLFSYIEKRELLFELKKKEITLKGSISDLELKNSLLSEKLDYDYIDMLIRDKLMLGKKGETTYIIVDNES